MLMRNGGGGGESAALDGPRTALQVDDVDDPNADVNEQLRDEHHLVSCRVNEPLELCLVEACATYAIARRVDQEARVQHAHLDTVVDAVARW